MIKFDAICTPSNEEVARTLIDDPEDLGRIIHNIASRINSRDLVEVVAGIEDDIPRSDEGDMRRARDFMRALAAAYGLYEKGD